MVKKILYTIGMMMFMATVVKPLYAISAEQFSAEDVPFSTARLSSKLVSAIGLNPAANWAEVFGEKDDEDVGHDLYAVIYEKTQDQPERQAFKNIAGRYGVPETDMVKIMYGDYSKILEKKPTLTQAEAYDKVAEIRQNFAEEKDILQLEADIKAAVEPAEIFANDDLDDSGFDLINDLQIIENLLFLKSQPIDVGGAFVPAENAPEVPTEGGAAGQPPAGGAGGGGTGGAGAGGAGAGATGSALAGAAGTQAKPIPGAISGGAATGQAGAAAGGAETVGGAGGAEGQLNPNTCFEENNYEKALNEFETNKATDKNLKDNSAAQTPSQEAVAAAGPAPQGGTGAAGGTSAAAGTATAGGASTAGSSATGGPGKQQPTTDFMQPIPQTAAPAQAAPADNWLQPKECDKVFCLFVDFVSAPVTSTYQDIDNCVACHAEKINDTLKKTINHTLTPSKAPGNLGESAKCKKAMWGGFDAVNMNIYATPIPVQTPANDDLIYGKNIEDEWYDFCNAMSFPFSCRKTEAPATPEASSYGIPPSLDDVAAKKVLTNASEAMTMDEASRNIATAIQGYESERQKDLQRLTVSEGADQAISFYDPLKVELDQMNFYFANIRDILHSLHEPVATMPGGQACTDLRDKKECE